MSASPISEASFDPAMLQTPEFHREPWEVFRYLRDHHPVWKNPTTNSWLVTRYDDVVAGFKDHARLSSTIMEQSHNVVFGPSLTAMDGDEHTQKRNIVAPEFVGQKLAAFLPVVEQNTHDLIEKFAPRAAEELIGSFAKDGEVDLVDAFSTRLPANVIIDALGLPKRDHDFFHACFSGFIAGLGPDPVRRQRAIELNRQFHAYIDPYVEERMRAPGEDLISKLCAAEVDGQKLSAYDIKSFASLLLTAGGETTDKAIANLWWLLLNHPEQFEQVKADPDLFDNAFTETMRHSGPVGGEPRNSLTDFEWHGQQIRRGDFVQVSMHSANRDERVFRDPDRFDIHRADLWMGKEVRVGTREDGRASHVGFGLGKHFCVGYQLARMEAVTGSKRLLEALKNPRIKPGEDPQIGDGMAMRSVKRLPVVWDA
ncbi:MAG: cytochrome P450 [Dehalococcoidia bacterium]